MNIEQSLRKPDFGMFILRVGMGALFVFLGVPKLLGGADKLELIGKAMSVYGISFFPVFWGFMAAISEVLGGVMLVLGLKTRIAAFFLAITMITATLLMYKTSGGDIMKYGWPLQSLFAFLGIMFFGPGRFSVDKG